VTAHLIFHAVRAFGRMSCCHPLQLRSSQGLLFDGW
jgi:hypothetical protein